MRIKKLQTQIKYDTKIIKNLHSKEQRKNLCLSPLLVNKNKKKIIIKIMKIKLIEKN